MIELQRDRRRHRLKVRVVWGLGSLWNRPRMVSARTVIEVQGEEREERSARERDACSKRDCTCEHAPQSRPSVKPPGHRSRRSTAGRRAGGRGGRRRRRPADTDGVKKPPKPRQRHRLQEQDRTHLVDQLSGGLLAGLGGCGSARASTSQTIMAAARYFKHPCHDGSGSAIKR